MPTKASSILLQLKKLAWPDERWRRIRNVSFQVYLVDAIVIHYLPDGAVLRLAALVGLQALLTCGIYAYEAWRRDRPHEDWYSGEEEAIVRCSDPEQHARYNPEPPYCDNGCGPMMKNGDAWVCGNQHGGKSDA